MSLSVKDTHSAFTLFIMAPRLVSLPIEIIENFCSEQAAIKVTRSITMLAAECADMQLLVKVEKVVDLRQKLKALAQTLQLDLVLMAQNEVNKKRKLAVFDMDSTLIKVEVIDELAKRAGVGEQVIAITAAAMRGELDFNQSFEQRLGLLKGLSATVLEDMAAQLPIMEGMEQLISALQQQGYKTAILSGGFSYFAEHLQNKYGFDYVYSNNLQIVDGKVTGLVVGEIVNGERKVELLQQIAKKEQINLSDTIAVGDGANDLPMLAVAGLGVAFHAKPLVKEQAEHSISTLGLDALLYLI
ncbi:MAG: phosphoserine phosphatase SerB [Oceanospirillaceae bacterium]